MLSSTVVRMSKLKIDAVQALRDIREGLNDIDLMKKYNLSLKGLYSLYSKLIAAGALSSSDVGPHFKLELRAKDVVADIRAGMSQAELAKKYRLSPKGLASMFRKLVRSRAVSKSEIERLSATREASPAEKSGTPAIDFDQWAASFDENIDQAWKRKDPDFG